MNFRNALIWMLAALAVVASMAFAPNVLATGPDNGPNYYDRDGDGKSDDSDECPDDPSPTCTREKCGTTTITGDGRRWTGEDCAREYNGAHGVQCPDGTYEPTYADCGSTRGTDSDSGTGGGRGGGGGSGGSGGSGQNGGNGASNASPALGVNIDQDAGVVKDCAASASRGGPPDLFSQVSALAYERMGNAVPLSYGSLAHHGPTTMGYTKREKGKVSITLDPVRIAENAINRPGDRSDWHEFAEVLFHEYHHAYDMLNCNCGNPHERFEPSITLVQYENDTQAKAVGDAVAVASCLPE